MFAAKQLIRTGGSTVSEVSGQGPPMRPSEVVAPVARGAFVGGFEAVLLTAGVAALVFAVVVGVLLGRPLPVPQPLPARSWCQASPRCCG